MLYVGPAKRINCLAMWEAGLSSAVYGDIISYVGEVMKMVSVPAAYYELASPDHQARAMAWAEGICRSIPIKAILVALVAIYISIWIYPFLCTVLFVLILFGLEFLKDDLKNRTRP